MNVFDTLSESIRRSPWIAVGFALVMFLLGQSTFVPLITGVAFSSMGIDQAGIIEISKGEVPISDSIRWVLLLAQVAHQLFAFGLPALLIAKALQYQSRDWGLEKSYFSTPWWLAILLMINALPLATLVNFDPELTYLPESFSETEQYFREVEIRLREQLEEFMSFNDPFSLFVNLVVFAAIPGVCEELFFRGVIQKSLQQVIGPWGAILLAALIFSFIHFQFYGFFGRAILGILLGFFFYRTGSLIPSILGHFAFNAFSIIGAYAVGLQSEAESASRDLQELEWYMYVGLAIVFVGLLALFWRMTTSQSPNRSETSYEA